MGGVCHCRVVPWQFRDKNFAQLCDCLRTRCYDVLKGIEKMIMAHELLAHRGKSDQYLHWKYKYDHLIQTYSRETFTRKVQDLWWKVWGHMGMILESHSCVTLHPRVRSSQGTCSEFFQKYTEALLLVDWLVCEPFLVELGGILNSRVTPGSAWGKQMLVGCKASTLTSVLSLNVHKGIFYHLPWTRAINCNVFHPNVLNRMQTTDLLRAHYKK